MSLPQRDLGYLANPQTCSGPIDIEGEDPDELLTWLDMMTRIRRVEEVVGDLVSNGQARCPCHLAIGQEACAVGVATVLKNGDVALGAHRSHSHYLAMGGSPTRLFAEILGRDSGCSRGLGGSMHLREPSIGLLGTVPIVAATIPIAVGAAMAASMDGNARIAVAFFGDGAVEEGAFHESLNLASVRRAPILFACENNLFSSHLHISQRQPFNSVARFAHAHGVEARVVDGNDIVAVRRATSALTDHIRNGNPGFLEAVTYRWRGHVGHREDQDVGVDRGQDLPTWKRRDPIRRLAEALISAGVLTEVEWQRRDSVIASEVANSLEDALAAPFPPPTLLLDAVYPHDIGERR